MVFWNSTANCFVPFAVLIGTAVFILMVCLILLRWSFVVR